MKSSTKKEGDNIQDKYDNLYLSLKNKNDYRKVLVLIEGPDDLYMYGLLLNPTRVVLEEHCSIQSGCATVMDMLKKINHKPFFIKKRKISYLAILDADFNRVLDNLALDENLIYTDYHDHEMMALHSIQAIEDVCRSLNVIEPEAIRDAKDIFKELALLTVFRWYNEEFSLGANFKKLDFQHLTQEQLSDMSFLVGEINSHSGSSRATLSGLRQFATTHVVSVTNQYDVTNGHDYVSRLAALLKNKYGHQHSDKVVERHVQSQLTPNKFHTTPMCQRIHEWERNHDIEESIVL